MVELVDTADLGSVAKALWVRVPSGARSCEGQILDQRTSSGFINCTVRWSQVKQLNFGGMVKLAIITDLHSVVRESYSRTSTK